ncbi:ERF family protein [Micromonosporaceae bacterium B7E4]
MVATLTEALAEFQAKPPTLVKNRSGQVGNQKTRYADLVEVNDKVLSRLNELGVIYICAPTRLDDGQFVLEYRLIHVESKDEITGRYPLKLSENPQQMGSAITYARRYVLLSLTGVAAEDEDDDGQAATGQRTARRAPQNRQQRTDAAPAGQQVRRQAPAGGPPLPGENPDGITQPQQALMHKILNDLGRGDRAAGLAYISEVLGREVTTTKEMTKADAKQVIDQLQKDVESQEPPA